MGEVDADVVEHGAGFDEAKVGAELGMSARDVEGAAAHLAAVVQKQPTQWRVDGIVAEEEGAVVHGRGLVLRSSRGAVGLAGAFFPSLSGRVASWPLLSLSSVAGVTA